MKIYLFSYHTFFDANMAQWEFRVNPHYNMFWIIVCTCCCSEPLRGRNSKCKFSGKKGHFLIQPTYCVNQPPFSKFSKCIVVSREIRILEFRELSSGQIPNIKRIYGAPISNSVVRKSFIFKQKPKQLQNVEKYETFSGDWVWICVQHNCWTYYHKF